MLPGRTTVVTLTQDHTPAREDEHARILAVGGSVTTNGSGAVNCMRPVLSPRLPWKAEECCYTPVS